MKITVILKDTQLGENIGASARAMLNFGLNDLRIVNPRDGWPNSRATDMASGALDHMPAPQIFDTLEAALADCHYALATTARPRDMVKPVFTPEEAGIYFTKDEYQGQTIALVFGAERTGLRNEDLVLCQGLTHIPTNPDFSSLNLAQAVLLLCYEFQKHKLTAPSSARENFPAPQDQTHAFLTRLNDELERHGFFRDEGLKPTMLRNIGNIFTRLQATEQEVKTLHGIVSALIGKKRPPNPDK